MTHRFVAALVLVGCLAPPVRSQIIGPGSTVAGDYMRGVGIAAWGMGSYNLSTAQANSINLDSWIRWREYVVSALKQENQEARERRARNYRIHQADWNKMMERIKTAPEELDVQRGDALNAKKVELNSPEVYVNSNPVPLPPEYIRNIPFKLGEKGARFSMQRFSLKAKGGRGDWTVALNFKEFDYERKAFQRAFDSALDKQLDGHLQQADIRAVEQSVEDLFRRFEKVVDPNEQKLYSDALAFLRGLKADVELLKIQRVKEILAEIERYPGNTVGDLMEFMSKHRLDFDEARTPSEKALYKKLYGILDEQLKAVKGTTRE
jgi:hypothetical protein